MWGEALAMLDRAQRLQRQFFTHADAASWEPPVDIVESDDAFQVHVALPGVAADAITVGIDAAGISISALRPFPCRDHDSQIHRLEIPYGRFERLIGMPPVELVGKRLENGILTLTFRRTEEA
jgi:HSP20 family protein